VIRGRLHRREGDGDRGPESDDEFVEIDAAELTGTFAAPGWLRDVGVTSWLLVGFVLLVAGVVALLALTQTIVMPLIAAGIVAAVASPLVAWLNRHGLPRGIGAALVLLGVVAVGVGVVVVIVGGITDQTDALKGELSDAKDTISGWLQDIGVDPSTADSAKNDASGATTSMADTLLHGLTSGIAALSSLVFFLSLTALSLFFLLKDGPVIREWIEDHVGLPKPVAHTIARRLLQALRAYFLGVTIVAIFNATVVGTVALVIGVPLAGTIAAVTFIGAYIPYLGAWSAGAFSVLVALGGSGTDAAVVMTITQLLANGILQQLIQPIAYGAALGIHPLAVLVVTIAGGALFGAVGLILAAPVTSAIVRISRDLAQAQAVAEPVAEPEPPLTPQATPG
jgi:predicted PurR-regulated permease PerM